MRILLTLLVVAPCWMNVASASLLEDLASPQQEVRDQAAEKLRASYRPAPDSKWTALLDGLKKGQTKDEVLCQLAPYKVTEEGGWGALNSYSTSYRLDEEFVLECGFLTNEGELLSGYVLTRSIKRVPVVPPERYTGKWIIYFANGNKSHDLEYQNGIQVGKQTSYHANGSVEHVRHFDAEGLQDGQEIHHDLSGRIRSRTHFRKGKQVGVSKWFDEAGKLAFTRKPPQLGNSPNVRLTIRFRPGNEYMQPAIRISLKNQSNETQEYVDVGYSRGLSFFEQQGDEWIMVEEFESSAQRRATIPIVHNEEVVLFAKLTEEMFNKLYSRTDLVAGIRMVDRESGALSVAYADEISYRE